MITGEYIGTSWIPEVRISGVLLRPDKSREIVNRSPDGFAWGYYGSGPAQLALAILLEFTDQKTAIRLYQDFKKDVIAGLPGSEGFKLPIAEVKAWINKNAGTKGEE
jgi:hypothetical protein